MSAGDALHSGLIWGWVWTVLIVKALKITLISLVFCGSYGNYAGVCLFISCTTLDHSLVIADSNKLLGRES